MPTLNQLASGVSHLLGKPLDLTLKERIKDDYKKLRATFLRQNIERNGIDQVLKVSYVLPLVITDKFDNCLVSAGCKLRRSTNKVGRPVRYKTDTPFTFVGTPDGYSFTYIREFSEVRLRKYLKNVKDAVLYGYKNDYIYVFNNDVENVVVEGIPENPEEFITVCDNTTCYNDDMEFPLPLDMIASITTEIYKIYGVKPVESNKVEINEDSKANVR